jgi:hypothetical protein
MRTKLLFPKIIKVKIDGFPIKNQSKNIFHNYMMFGSGTLLAISETLPFMSDTKANGIIDAIKKIRDEFKSLE